MNRRNIGVLFFLLFQMISTAAGQDEPDINRYLDMIRKGDADKVKAELPNLLSRYQRNPGVIYLQGMLTADGAEAAKIFQNVVDNFPQSEWADDGLYKVYQFYYSLGLYKTAEEKLAQLKVKYPQSEYVTGKKPEVAAAPPPPQPSAGTPDETGVSTQPPGPPPSSPLPKVASTGSAYSVQVGAFREMENATTLKNFFEREGYSVELRNKVRNGQSLHAVWVGSFGTLGEARTFSQNLQEKYKIDSFVVSR